MKHLGWFFIIFGVFFLLLEIVTGEICIGKSKTICYLYSEDPKKYWIHFFVYPSFCFAIGRRIIMSTGYNDVNLMTVLEFIFTVFGGIFLGYLISLLY
jgi:hypothetical protein